MDLLSDRMAFYSHIWEVAWYRPPLKVHIGTKPFNTYPAADAYCYTEQQNRRRSMLYSKINQPKLVISGRSVVVSNSAHRPRGLGDLHLEPYVELTHITREVEFIKSWQDIK